MTWMADYDGDDDDDVVIMTSRNGRSIQKMRKTTFLKSKSFATIDSRSKTMLIKELLEEKIYLPHQPF